MDKKKPVTWITVNGKHIPIYADKPTADEKLKESQINSNRIQMEAIKGIKNSYSGMYKNAGTKNSDSANLMKHIPDEFKNQGEKKEESWRLKDPKFQKKTAGGVYFYSSENSIFGKTIDEKLYDKLPEHIKKSVVMIESRKTADGNHAEIYYVDKDGKIQWFDEYGIGDFMYSLKHTPKEEFGNVSDWKYDNHYDEGKQLERSSRQKEDDSKRESTNDDFYKNLKKEQIDRAVERFGNEKYIERNEDGEIIFKATVKNKDTGEIKIMELSSYSVKGAIHDLVQNGYEVKRGRILPKKLYDKVIKDSDASPYDFDDANIVFRKELKELKANSKKSTSPKSDSNLLDRMSTRLSSQGISSTWEIEQWLRGLSATRRNNIAKELGIDGRGDLKVQAIVSMIFNRIQEG